MDTIKTASGKTYTTDLVSVIDTPCRAYVRIVNSTLPEVATTFGDKEATKELL